MKPLDLYNPSLDAAGPPSSGGSFGSGAKPASGTGVNRKKIVPPASTGYQPGKNLSDSYKSVNPNDPSLNYQSQNDFAMDDNGYGNEDAYKSVNSAGYNPSGPVKGYAEDSEDDYQSANPTRDQVRYSDGDSYRSQTEGRRDPQFAKQQAENSAKQSAKTEQDAAKQSYINQYNPIKRIGAAKDQLVDDAKTAVRDVGKKIARDAVTPGTALGEAGSMFNKAYQGVKGLSADPEAMREEARERVRQFAKDKGKEFAKDRIKGVGKDAAKSAAKGAAKEGAEAAAKGAAKKVGKQAAMQGGKAVAAGALAAAETGAAFTGVGILVDILVDIALYLGFNDAFDGTVAISKGHIREGRFLLIRAAMKVLMGIILIITISMVWIPILGFVLVNLLGAYYILGKIFKKTAQLQGITDLEAAILFVLWVVSFSITGAFIYAILYWICIESGKSVVGWLAITAIKIYSWFNDNAVNEICNHVGQIANGTVGQ